MAEMRREFVGVYTGLPTVDFLGQPGMHTGGMEHVLGGKEPMTPHYAELAEETLQSLNNDNPTDFEVHGGGGATNAAVAAALLGDRPRLVVVLGDEDLGSRAFRQDMESVPGLTLDAEVIPGLQIRRSMLIQAKIAGESQPNRTWYREDHKSLSMGARQGYLNRLAAAAISAQYAYFGSVEPSLVRDALDSIPAGVTKVFNPSSLHYTGNGKPKNPEDIRAIVEEERLLGGILGVNVDEITKSWGYSSPNLDSARQAARDASKYVGRVLVSAGREGGFSTILAINGNDMYVETPYDEPYVPDQFFKNNGGAGDWTLAGYTYAALRGYEEKRALIKGTELAGLVCRSVGAHLHDRSIVVDTPSTIGTADRLLLPTLAAARLR